MLPAITILVCTYNRPVELIRVLDALSQFLRYDGEVRILITDDHSPAGYKEKLEESRVWQVLNPRFISTSQNGGWGANVNNGLFHCDTEFIFFLEDDYVLTDFLDLSIGVATMIAQPDLGMIRYRGTAGDHLIYHQFEADIYRHLPDFRQGVGLPGKVSYLQIDSGSPSLYIYSHGPHLKSTRFHSFYGPYPTGMKLGATEEAYAHTVKDGMVLPYAPSIAIFPEWIAMKWDHIGESYQHGELDKGK